MRSLVALTTLFLLAILCGCGASLPTEDAAKQALQEHISKSSSNRLQLVAFHKTNGESDDKMGYYGMDFEGEIEVAEDCVWYRKGPFEPKEFHTDPLAVANGNAMLGPKDIAKKGLRRKISGSMSFGKKEKGWQWVESGSRIELL